MKKILPLCLIVLSSCGAQMAPKDGASLGEIRNGVVSPASDALKSGISGLCQSLRDKEASFRLTYLPSRTVFNFDSSYKDCTNVVQGSSVKAQLVEGASGLQFSVLSGSYFSMGLETATVGNISVLCRDVQNLKTPMMIGTTTAVWFSFLPADLCDGGNTNTACLQMEIGFLQPTGQYKVSITDRYDVSLIAGTLSGMVKSHVRTDLSTCSEGSRVETRSVFKGISPN